MITHMLIILLLSWVPLSWRTLETACQLGNHFTDVLDFHIKYTIMNIMHMLVTVHFLMQSYLLGHIEFGDKLYKV